MSAADVLLLRSPDDPDPYVSAFAQLGLKARCEPVLRFEFPNQTRLQRHLRRSSVYDALIATSPRVGQALHKAFRADSSLRELWHERPAYVVGPKTGAWLEKLGFQNRGQKAGSAETLARQIVSDAPDLDFLFLCGNRRRDALPDALRKGKVSFEELTVYETHPRSTLNLPSTTKTSWLVFFSPSGIEAVTNGSRLSGYRLAAIGSTTAGALRKAGYVVEAVASEPTPDGLVTAVAQAL